MEHIPFAVFCLIVSFMLISPLAIAIDPFADVYTLCNTAKFANDSSFSQSLNSLLVALHQKSSYTKYYHASSHANSTQNINAIFQCRGDVPLDVCAQCVSNATQVSLNSCSDAIGSRVQLDGCYLRYENYSFMTPDSSIVEELCNTRKNSSAVFKQEVEELVTKVISEAPKNGGYASSTGEGGTYGLAQCLGYLTEKECADCLSAHPKGWQDCNDGVGAQIHTVSCYYRFEIYPFYYKA